MTARIQPKRTRFSVTGKLTVTAPILAWLADQTPSAVIKAHDRDEYQRTFAPGDWWGFDVYFENDTDEVNFKMFQSEAFEAGAELASQKPLAGTVMIGTKPTSLVINPAGFVTGYSYKRGGK
jgi:hypothetical protein